ncbi:hypothetical protein PR048_032144 [Dryococelus australis]|uniref:Syntaxin 6/10/61 N-terminal domain-containing protein n=1 Tax=Dryococelus australis TaxID=614101 RepID=A0ABQ9G1D6_9NEOP|nr:hypothetical protein PR048_032144 [Dryococelus australis]
MSGSVLCISCCSEVCKALNKTCGLYRRYLELHDDSATCLAKDELEWTTTELRNALRSIEWDLEDLDDTINILCEQSRGRPVLGRVCRHLLPKCAKACHASVWLLPYLPE